MERIEEEEVIVGDANANKSCKATLSGDPDSLITGQLKTSPMNLTLSATPTLQNIDLLNESKLIGDRTKPFRLPILDFGMRHSDLPTISVDTLASLLRGDFYKVLRNNYQIIDCRYPYEFNGGHIRGALNLYSHDHMVASFPPKGSIVARRSIYVFHCEFSSHRAPTMMRFVRNNDRNAHIDDYPLLEYPELYLLQHGYKGFHTSYMDLCTPKNYVPMLAPEHAEEYHLFHSKTKLKKYGNSAGGSLSRSHLLLNSRSRSRSGDHDLKSKKY